MPPLPEDTARLESELIGCELHDGPCQYIASAKMLLEALRHEGIRSTGGDGKRLDKALELLERTNQELRCLIRGLQPEQINETQAWAIAKWLSDENAALGGPEIEWCTDSTFDACPDHLKLPILRIMQECLANVRRHSMTSKVLVGITQDERSVCLQVQDWGVGFDPDEPHPGCHGLEGIRRRAKLLHGSVTIESRPGEGTCIAVEFPLQQPNPASGPDAPLD